MQGFQQDKWPILRSAAERYLWERRQDEEQRRKAEEMGGEDEEMGGNQEEEAIEWHDFVVVEKIELYDDEEMKAIEEEERGVKEREQEEKNKKMQIKQQIEEN